ncbi:MAG: hypothetical protein LUF92_09840 [Clostridiales bacterium]|nr:hypothetical protein [Clostridiales bacterium]
MKSEIIRIGVLIIIMVIAIALVLEWRLYRKNDVEVISERQEVPITYDENQEDLTPEDIQRMNQGNAEIIYSASSEYVREIGGIFTSQSIREEEDAVMAIMSVRSLMGIQGESFCCESITEEESGQKVFLLYQLYEGVTVEDGLFRIVAADDGTPMRIRGGYVRDLSVGTEAQITAQEGLSGLTLSRGQNAESARLVIKTIESQNILCWKYTVTRENDIAQDEAIYVDAQTGEVVLTVSLTVE